MSTLAERFIAAVETAMELNTHAHHSDGLPAAIVHAIEHADEPHDGLKAATYEVRISSGHRGDSHPERMTLAGVREGTTPNRWKRDDTIAVSRAGLAFIDAVSAINASRDHGTADTWNEALADASTMADMHDGEFIEAAIDLAHDASPFHEAIRSVKALRRLALAWNVAHVATIQERLQHPDVCLSHARIGVERPVIGRMVICKLCRDKIAEWGEPTQVHRDPDAWPWLEILNAIEAGQRIEARRLTNEYLRFHGVDVAASTTTPRFRVNS